MRQLLILLIVICGQLWGAARLPDITPNDVKTKISEILKAHVSYKKITPALSERILQNFLEELDPLKIYFIESDIAEWAHPTPELLQALTNNFSNNEYSIFEQIHNKMLAAIQRRNELEIEVDASSPLTPTSFDELKGLSWATSKEELLCRLLKIKALHIEAGEKLGEDPKDQFLEMLKKRRLQKEHDLSEKEPSKKQKLLLSLILKAFSSSLDAHTNYFTPAEANQFMFQVQQRLFGIGALLKDSLSGFSVVRVIENSPASLPGKLRINDRIIAVNKEPIVGMDITEAVELIRGEKGSIVLLTVLREDADKKTQKMNISLERGEVVLEEARTETFEEPFADGSIINLRLHSFYQDQNTSSAQDLKKHLENYKKEHRLKAVVLDLRNNAGGFLPQAVEVAGLFIGKGIVVSAKDNSGHIQHWRNTDGKVTWDGPLIVLVSKASASAAEIVAQTLQDYGRAIIVGDEATFGKGTFQTFTLDAIKETQINPKGEYNVTRGCYYTVSGKSPQLTGVISDIPVPGILSEMEIGEKFSKFPLENDSILAGFEDNLQDVPLSHRTRISLLYKNNLQQRLSTYTKHLPVLHANSQKRIKNSAVYQSFLNEIKEKKYDTQPVEIFNAADLQLTEAINVAKDLSFLVEVTEKNYD